MVWSNTTDLDVHDFKTLVFSMLFDIARINDMEVSKKVSNILKYCINHMMQQKSLKEKLKKYKLFGRQCR